MIKKFNEYITEQNLGIKFGIKELINELKPNEIDFYKLFDISRDIFDSNTNISDLYSSNDFTTKVDEMDLRKDVMQNTEDSETLLYKKYTLKFFFLLDKNAVQIEEPKYIFYQYHNSKNNSSSDIVCTEHNGSITDFYGKMTDSTIEIKKGDKSYIYTTSNAGNNWELKNPSMKTKDFKEELDKSEIKKL